MKEFLDASGHLTDMRISLAIAEMRLILARLLYAFDVKLREDCEDWMNGQVSFALWSKPPLNVYLTPVARKPVS